MRDSDSLDAVIDGLQHERPGDVWICDAESDRISQFRPKSGLCYKGLRPLVLELSMPSSLYHSMRMMRMPNHQIARLATICLVCVFCVLPSASAQSQTTPYRSHGSTHYTTHYGSASRVHTVDQKPHSVPSSVVPEVLGKASGGAAKSPNKELDQLERASAVKPMTVKSGALSASAKITLTPEKHSAPINFSHKELPHSPHSGRAKIH